MKWNWNNFLIPTFYLVALAIGSALQLYFPRPGLFSTPWIGTTTGSFIMIAGIFLQVWSTFAAGNINLEAPIKLITTGPYTHSRNPMYTAWLVIYLGTTVLLNSPWLLVLFPVITVYVHFKVILSEEKVLANRFGEEYFQYIDRVRRYF